MSEGQNALNKQTKKMLEVGVQQTQQQEELDRGAAALAQKEEDLERNFAMKEEDLTRDFENREFELTRDFENREHNLMTDFENREFELTRDFENREHDLTRDFENREHDLMRNLEKREHQLKRDLLMFRPEKAYEKYKNQTIRAQRRYKSKSGDQEPVCTHCAKTEEFPSLESEIAILPSNYGAGQGAGRMGKARSMEQPVSERGSASSPANSPPGHLLRLPRLPRLRSLVSLVFS